MSQPKVARWLQGILKSFAKTAPIRKLRIEALEERQNPTPIAAIQGLNSQQMLLGEAVNFNFNFANPGGSKAGFAPFIDVVVDSSGVDGATSTPLDGYGTPTVTAAGLPLAAVSKITITAGQTTYTHPITGDTRNVPAGFGKNDSIYVYSLPFGSFSKDQTTGVTISVPTSNLADVGKALPISVTGGYRDDEAALNGPAIYGTEAKADATPELYRFRKIYVGPEDETATGPNFVRRYRLEVDIADKQTLTNFRINDDLAPSMQIAGKNVTKMAAFVAPNLASNIFTVGNLSGSAVATAPDGTLSYNFGNVTGTSGKIDAAYEFDFYVPLNNSGGTQTLPQTSTTGTDSKLDTNTGSTQANWTPIDTRDASGPVDKAAPDNGPHNLEEQSLAIQKNVEAIDPTTGLAIPAGQSIRPGQTLLRYTLNFQVSDYYAVEDVIIRDVMGDAQRLFTGTRGVVTAGLPTMTVNNAFLPGSPGGSRTTTLTAPFGGTGTINYQRRFTSGIVDADPTSIPANGPASTVFSNLAPAPSALGTTYLQFNVSEELKARLGATAGRLVGGEIANNGTGPFNNPLGSQLFGGATGTIVFYAEITRNFSDAFPSTDRSVDHGDILNNTVNDPLTAGRDGITGTQLLPSSINAPVATPIGLATDDSGTSVSIPYGLQEKQIYAINGQTVPAQGFNDPPLSLQPGDRVTYRLNYSLPISSFEQLRLVDFPPLPVMDVTSSGPFTFIRNPGAYTFLPGAVGVGPSDTYFNTFAPANGAGRNPAITADADNNSVTMDFGTHDDPLRQSTQISLLITFVVGNQPFSSDLFLTNQLRVLENSTNAGNYTVEDLRRFELVRPFVTVQKGTAAGNTTGFTVGSGADQINFGGTDKALPAMGSTVGSTVLNRAGTALSGTNAITTPTHSNSIGGRNIGLADNIDAGDRVRYAIVVQNTGRGDAFDVRLTDTIPAQYDRAAFTPASNLRVVRGDGTVLTAGTDYSITYNNISGDIIIDLFDDYSAGNIGGAQEDNRLGGLSRGSRTAGEIDNGSDTIVVLYDVTLLNNVAPNQTINNTATIPSYANSEGGTDLTTLPGATDPTNTATVITRLPLVTKTLVNTEIDAAGNNLANQATIGEFVTYRVRITIPEGTISGSVLTDTLGLGLAFVSVDSVATSGGVVVENATGVGTNPANTTITNDGRTLTFNFGTISNTTVNNGAEEFIEITYRVVVLNTNGASGSANNQAGQTRNNAADFDWTGNVATTPAVQAGQATNSTGAATGTATPITIVEPTVATVKDVSNSTAGTPFGQIVRGDAGDEIDFRITLNASGSTAHEVTLSDPLPTGNFAGGFTLLSATSTGTIRFNGTARAATLADFVITGGTLSFVSGLDVDMEPGSSIVVTVRGNDFTGSTGQVISNTAEARWTSLNGAPGTRSIHNTSSTERGGQDGPLNGGALNDYRTSDNALIESPPVIRKTIVATSEAHTTGSQTAIGEIVRFRIYFSVGETPTGSPTTNVQLRDFLPAGMSFVNDGSSRFGFISSNGTNLTSSTLAGGSITGSEASLATLLSSGITGLFADGDISTSTAVLTGEPSLYGNGQDVFFRFGNISNADRDGSVEYIVFEYNVLVRNESTNQAGTNLINRATTLVNGVYNDIVIDANGDGLGTGEATITVDENNPSNLPSAQVTVVEPNVQIAKQAISTTGSVVTYRLTITNPAGPNTTTGFNTRILDVLDGVNLSLINVSSIILGSGATGSTNNSAGNTVDILIDTLPVGGTVTIEYTANVLTTPTGTATLNNIGKSTTTSLPGTQGTLPFFGTTGATIGASGSATGERTGADGIGGSLNDYAASAKAQLGSLGNRVYFDANADGKQDVGEPGLVGVPVTVLYSGPDGIFGNADDSSITVSTGSNGEWTVTGLPIGTSPYKVSVPTVFAGMDVTDAVDDGALNKTNTSTITLTGANANTTNNRLQDFGFVGTAKLGNRIYIDANGDGVQAANGLEPTLPGVTVNLSWAGADGTFGNADDLTFTSVSNNATGTNPNYLFQNLPAGEFKVAVSGVGGTGGVPDNMTLTDSIDNGGAASPVAVVTTNLTTGEVEPTIDFGYKGNASIGDYVWYDADGDGVQDANEPPIAGANATLLWAGPDGVLGNGDDVTFTTVTDANGKYTFPSLPVNGATDPYQVTIQAPAGYPTVTFDADGKATPNTSKLNLGPTENNTTQDFGYQGTAKLGNFVWLDDNGNGKQDAGEAGVVGVDVELLFDANND
ncbi:MAG: beta strand repeat-containing protein, partial [Fimbriiglobus sp.]